MSWGLFTGHTYLLQVSPAPPHIVTQPCHFPLKGPLYICNSSTTKKPLLPERTTSPWKDHCTSAALAPPINQRIFLFLYDQTDNFLGKCWTTIRGWLCTSLRVSRLSGADYLRAIACPSQGTSIHTMLILRPCSLIIAGYLRGGDVRRS